MAQDWFRHPTWDDAIAAEFEARLARARIAGRAQYLRIQAVTLLPSEQRLDRDAGRALLTRLIDQYPESFEVAAAWEALGESLAREGDLAGAEAALRSCLAVCRARPTGKSGTSYTPEVGLAAVLVRAGGDRDEAAMLLAGVEPDVAGQGFIAATAFRFELTCARLAARDDEPVAGTFARRALDLADHGSHEVLPRHRDLAQVEFDPAVRAELQDLAARHPHEVAFADVATAFGVSAVPAVPDPFTPEARALRRKERQDAAERDHNG